MKNRRGFTLIELLIVITIIGLLAGIIMVALDESREKGRDANRASQMQEFLNAAELYYSDTGTYPDDGVADNGNDVIGNSYGFIRSQGGYINNLPADPSYSATEGYYYCASDDGSSMTIFIHTESGSGDYCYITLGTQNTSYCGTDITTSTPIPISGLSKCTDRF